MGCSVSFQLPPTSKHKICKPVVCVVYASDAIFGNAEDLRLLPPPRRPKNYDTPITGQDHMWMKCYGKVLLRGGDQVEIVVSPGEGLNVKKCGIHLFDPNERNTQSDGGELMLYNSASNENAIVDDDDDDDDNGLPPHVSEFDGHGFSILTCIDGNHRYFEFEFRSKS
ncbi:hypothetical protein L1049_000163 [Liquidambar formosana]|uniref:Uncharacterized protein n=1 Tax=Liquidambar formosana TaxID=63359 RepID=A0AAP0N8B1_LIQFO